MSENPEKQVPSGSVQNSIGISLDDLHRMLAIENDVSERNQEVINNIFDILVGASQEQVEQGKVCTVHDDQKVTSSMKVINRLFELSSQVLKGGMVVINPDLVQQRDKKAYAMAMAIGEGRPWIAVLGEIVNEEMQQRKQAPEPSPGITSGSKAFPELQRSQ